MFRVFQLLVVTYAFAINLVTVKDWQKIATQKDVVYRKIHVVVNQTMASAELFETSLIQCTYRCQRLSSLSFYYMETDGRCYCNDAKISFVDGGDTSEPKVIYGVFRTGEVFKYQDFKKWVGVPEGVDCYQYYISGFVTDGIYFIKPYASIGFEVWCDMVKGGWTVFQNRYDGSVNFNRGWTDYRDGFGELTGEFWLGLDSLHLLADVPCEVLMEMTAPQGKIPNYAYLRFSNLTVGGPETNFALFFEKANNSCNPGMLHDFFLYGRQFSTPDVDKDTNPRGSCAKDLNSGWWFDRCFAINLNGVYGPSSRYAHGLVFQACWGYHTSVEKSKMKLRMAH